MASKIVQFIWSRVQRVVLTHISIILARGGSLFQATAIYGLFDEDPKNTVAK